jgi:hypothetical protein
LRAWRRFALFSHCFTPQWDFVFITLSHRSPANPAQQPPPLALGWAFVVFGIFLFLLATMFAIVVAFAGRSLSRRDHYWFAFVVACVGYIFVPFGTILGVFTIIVLSRESVKMLFSPVMAETPG